MNVGLYTRVSTEVQAQGESLEDQLHDGTAWADSRGYVVAAVYSDPGLSGKLPANERPGLLEALDALDAGLIGAVVVRDLDRLARELTVQEAVLAQVWARPGTAVYEYAYSREVLRDDPDDPMRTAMRQVQGVFAQLERAMIAKRMRDGRRNKARRGQHANGPAPFGWTTVGGELIPNHTELETLDALLRHAESGLTHEAIAAALNTARFQTRRGGQWSQPVVSRILRRHSQRTPAQVAYQLERMSSGSQ